VVCGCHDGHAGTGAGGEEGDTGLHDVIHGDSVEVLCGFADGAFQLCVTSPPYDDLRTYGGHSWDFEGTARELYRTICDGGIVCWNVGDAVVNGSETLSSFKQAIFFKEQCGFLVHDTMIWHKPNFSNPSSTRYHQLFEYIFILTKGKPRCFNPIKDKPNKYPNGPWGKNTFRKANGEMGERAFKPAKPFGMRGNVWSGNTVGQENGCRALKHPAQMPKWLARDLIISWSNEGDHVVDPFSGSGTTAMQAIALKRKATSIDSNLEYVNLMRSLLVAIPLLAD
jgi:DNA modification methylase